MGGRAEQEQGAEPQVERPRREGERGRARGMVTDSATGERVAGGQGHSQLLRRG